MVVRGKGGSCVIKSQGLNWAMGVRPWSPGDCVGVHKSLWMGGGEETSLTSSFIFKLTAMACFISQIASWRVLGSAFRTIG